MIEVKRKYPLFSKKSMIFFYHKHRKISYKYFGLLGLIRYRTLDVCVESP